MHLDNTLQIAASIYEYNYDGYQDRLNVFDPVRNRGVDIVQNAEGATNRGFEVEGLWLATNNITVGGNYSYTDAFYSEDYFVIESDNPAFPQSLFGNFIHNVKNDQLKLIPKHKATIWGSYDVVTNIGNFSFRGTYSYTGKMSDAGIQRDLDVVPDRFRLDVAVIWEDVARKWSVRGFVDNATDEDNVRGLGTAGESDNWRLSGAHLYPRYWGVDLKYRFGG